MRRSLTFAVEGALCAATIDNAPGSHGLLIVTGGNEIRSGAHRGMARLAAAVAAAGHPVLRFDRRGIGDSEGENAGFEGSAADIAASLALFRKQCPHLTHITAFGNCDAATALLLHHRNDGPDALLLANPWTIDAATVADGDAHALPPPATIRARYVRKLKDPREWLRLLRGAVDLSKLARGLRSVMSGQLLPSSLVDKMAAGMAAFIGPVTILLAQRDGTAMAFAAHWPTAFGTDEQYVSVEWIDTASHGFADVSAKAWLEARVLEALAR